MRSCHHASPHGLRQEGRGACSNSDLSAWREKETRERKERGEFLSLTCKSHMINEDVAFLNLLKHISSKVYNLVFSIPFTRF
jgi:hypothetical protein